MAKNPFKKLYRNVCMSADYGAAGARVDNNPKLSGRVRKPNQSTKRHKIDITEEDLRNLYAQQGGRCFWLGTSLELDELFVPHSPLAPSVDRLDNDKDYTIDNVVICTRFVNKGRGNCTKSKFLEVVQKIKESLNSQPHPADIPDEQVLAGEMNETNHSREENPLDLLREEWHPHAEEVQTPPVHCLCA